MQQSKWKFKDSFRRLRATLNIVSAINGKRAQSDLKRHKVILTKLMANENDFQ